MYKWIKSLLDFIVSLIAIVVLSPLYLLITLVSFGISLENPFFIQIRPGINEKYFALLKFKTMNGNKKNNGELLSDQERLTFWGKILRKTSLDELPQLLNVLKGDMSIIGPRPLLVQYLPFYNSTQKRRHEVKPGITGWAQVNGRNAISWEKKFEYDVWYVDNQSFLLDVKIIFLTIKKVFRSEGISQLGNATMEIFKGSK